jgi:hypothetical protein
MHAVFIAAMVTTLHCRLDHGLSRVLSFDLDGTTLTKDRLHRVLLST